MGASGKPLALPARDWFAGLAMQGLVSSWTDEELDVQAIAEVSYALADAMLEERCGKPEIIEAIEPSLAGHPQRLPGPEWRALFNKRMDEFLERRGLGSGGGMRALVNASFRETAAKKKRREEGHDVD